MWLAFVLLADPTPLHIQPAKIEKDRNTLSSLKMKWRLELQTAAGCELVMQPARKAVSASQRDGRPGLSAESRATLQQKWAQHVQPHTGFADFAAMALALEADHRLWTQAELA